MSTPPRDRTASPLTLIDQLCDPGSFHSWDTPTMTSTSDEAYARELAAARERSGSDESIVTGTATLAGRPVALVVSDFEFLGGTVGVRSAERVADAFRRAVREGLPVIGSPASGGTRMQEGTAAFLGMVDLSAAVQEHLDSGLPYLAYLRHPTTGGVMASWGSLAHVTVSEPGALLGFLGPRAVEAVQGELIPDGVQIAENLLDHGLLDAVLRPEQAREYFASALDHLTATVRRTGRTGGAAHVPQDALQAVPSDAWAAVQATRRPDRPRGEDLVQSLRSHLWLSGDGQGAREDGIRLALARFGVHSAVMIVQTGRPDADLGPRALRVARRGLRLAQDVGLPVVTIVDTPGATLSPEAENDGLAGQIARCLSELLGAPVPTVSVLMGQGCGGAALALLPADRTIASSHSWLAPLPPEGASGIVHRTPDRAADLANAQGIGVGHLLPAGVVDSVVPDASVDGIGPERFLVSLAEQVERHLQEASPSEGPPGVQASRRSRRYDTWAALVR